MSDTNSESPSHAANDDPTATSIRASSWSMIGDYRIIRKLGEGGMGVVYEVEQQHPRRAAALKLMRGGRHVDEHAVKLFQREAQALARLKHPGIAAIYEAGRTNEGEHFFAMELVRGLPLLEYVKSRMREAPGEYVKVAHRLRLFCKICEAVNYAHQRGVIHRDLKPSNILVSGTVQSGQSSPDVVPEIKILDFGLAKITDADIAATTILTDIGSIQGTLAYMSPEQARGNPDEIDLRSDIYSLGVMLYELLTGEMPYPVRGCMPHEAVRAICEKPPQLPMRLSLDPGGPGKNKIDRDVETIVVKALEKEPWRRYQNALALAEDIDRYLGKQPILARPPSTVYQLRKLVARHTAAFAFVVTLAVLLAGFGVMMTVQSARIVKERDRAVAAEESATQVSSFLVDLFKISNPSEARGNSVTAREILDRGAAKITGQLQGQPLVQARLMDTMGQVFESLGLYDQALPLVTKALENRRKEQGRENLEAAATLAQLGGLWWHKGQYAKARPMLEESLAIREKLLGPDHPLVASSLHSLGNLDWSRGDYDQAQRLIERALAIRERTLASDDPNLANTFNSLGAIAYKRAHFAKAQQIWERTLAIRERTLGAEHPLIAQTLNNLAVVHTDTDDLVGARDLLRRVVGIQEKVLGPKHPDLASALSNLGDVLYRTHDYAQARKCYQRAVEIQESAGPQHPELARFLSGEARVFLAEGNVRMARELFQRSLSIQERVFGKDHAELAGSLAGLAECDRKAGHLSQSEAGFKRALALCRGSDGKYGVGADGILESYAGLLRDMHRDTQAAEVEALYRSFKQK